MAKSDSTISVACRLPSGFTIDHLGDKLTLNGPLDPGAILGFGITRDVNADWFKSWAEGGKDADDKPIGVGKSFAPLGSGAIFPIDSNDVAGAVRERTGATTGFEPLNADAPMDGIEPTDEQKKELAKIDPDAPAAPAKPSNKPGEAKKK